MKRILLQRLALLPVLAIGVTLVAFVLLHLAPGDPRQLAGGPAASTEQVEAVRVQYGLNKPLPVQYLRYVLNLTHGDLGESFTYQEPVAKLLGDRFPRRRSWSSPRC